MDGHLDGVLCNTIFPTILRYIYSERAELWSQDPGAGYIHRGNTRCDKAGAIGALSCISSGFCSLFASGYLLRFCLVFWFLRRLVVHVLLGVGVYVRNNGRTYVVEMR